MKKIVILSGAGISAESGISTFRDSDGLWENYKVEEVASIEGWYKDKGKVLQFYNLRRKDIESKNPNKAHLIVAQLQEKYNVTVVTQNIDNLHERAGSKKVIHLHGEITKGRGEGENYYDAIDIGYTDIQLGDKAKDGSQLRPHIVWFGEAVPELEKGIKAVSEADILIVVGTSLVVYPAAGLINYTKNNCRIFLIDPNDVSTNVPHTHIKEKASVGMEKLLNIIDKL